MNKHLIVSGIVVLLIYVGLSGCTDSPLQSDEDRFVGTWHYNQYGLFHIMILYTNGTLFASSSEGNASGTYEIKDGKFVMEGLYGVGVYNYSFSNDGKKLTLHDVNNSIVFEYNKQ